MTHAQLQTLLRWSVRYIKRHNDAIRWSHTDPATRQISGRSVALDVAKTDMWLARARTAVAKSGAARKAK